MAKNPGSDQDGSADAPEPPALRLLRGLVTVLTGVMILGMGALVFLFFTRFPTPDRGALPDLPDRIALPAGITATAVTAGDGWLAVVTTDGRLLFFDAATGALQREVLVQPDD